MASAKCVVNECDGKGVQVEDDPGQRQISTGQNSDNVENNLVCDDWEGQENGQVASLFPACFVAEEVKEKMGLNENELLRSLVNELEQCTVQLMKKQALAVKLEKLQNDQEKAIEAHKEQLIALETSVRSLESLVSHHENEKDKLLAICAKEAEMKYVPKEIFVEREQLKVGFFQRKKVIEEKVEEVQASLKRFNDGVKAGAESIESGAAIVAAMEAVPLNEQGIEAFESVAKAIEKVEQKNHRSEIPAGNALSGFGSFVVEAEEDAGEEAKPVVKGNSPRGQRSGKNGVKKPSGCGCEFASDNEATTASSATQNEEGAKARLSPKHKKMMNKLKLFRKRK